MTSVAFSVLLTLVAVAGVTTGVVAACWPGLYTPDTSRVDPVEASGDWDWPAPWTDEEEDEA